MGSKRLVLATSSPTRRELLGRLGIPFEVVDPGEVSEVLSGSPREVVLRNARAKVESVLRRGVGRDSVVVSFDTVIYFRGRVVGKAGNEYEAIRYLRMLRGRWHAVFTGVVIHDVSTGTRREFVVRTKVKMRAYSDEEIEAYVSTGEPVGKAGGYAIQGKGALLVEKVEGDPYNVAGVPLARLQKELLDLGINLMEFK